MLKAAEGGDKLVLRDFPGLRLLGGAAVVFVAALLASSSFDFTRGALLAGNYHWTVFVPAGLYGILFLAGIYSLVRAPVITTTIDRRAKSVGVEKSSLLKKTSDHYRFDEIEPHLSIKTESYKGTSYYKPQITLKTGEKIDLVSEGFMNRGKTYDVIDLAGRYLADEADKDNFRLTIINDD